MEAPQKKKTKVGDGEASASQSNKKQKTEQKNSEVDEVETEEFLKPPPRVLASVKAMLQEARQDPAQWHHIKVLYKSLYDEVTPETLTKYKNWGLSMYWGKGRVAYSARVSMCYLSPTPSLHQWACLEGCEPLCVLLSLFMINFLILLRVVASKNQRSEIVCLSHSLIWILDGNLEPAIYWGALPSRKNSGRLHGWRWAAMR